MPHDPNQMRNIDRAYEEAKNGALEGALRWGVYGTIIFSGELLSSSFCMMFSLFLKLLNSAGLFTVD